MGDCLFASSVARKLKEANMFDVVDFVVGLRQSEELLNLNPYIDNVIRTSFPDIAPLFDVVVVGYDEEIQLSPTVKYIPPPAQFQIECKVPDHMVDTKFEVWTDPEIDEGVAQKYPNDYIAVMNIDAWKEKAFRFTEADYIRGEDVPYLGYGGHLRNISSIVTDLAIQDFTLVEVGLDTATKTMDASPTINKHRSLLWDASVIKRAKFFIGAEGGLANIAAGVHTTTVLTGEFVAQLYGYNGVVRKINDPHLGPRFYWPEDGHVDLCPYLTDQQVVQEMTAIFNKKKTAEDYTYDWTTP